MNSLCDDLYCYCVNFLEIQEFMMLLRSSKVAGIKMKRLIKWRKPYIKQDSGIRCMKKEAVELICKLKRDNEKSNSEYDNINDGAAVHVILKLGASNVLKDVSNNIQISAVPWCFRKHMDYEMEYFGKSHIIKYDKFICDKLLKYRNKIENITDLNKKLEKKIYYFDKLEKWQILVNKYRTSTDVYMIFYNERLDNLIY